MSVGPPEGWHLEGWRCRSCGFGAASEADLERAVADLAGGAERARAERRHLLELCRGSGIETRAADPMRPCPACGGTDTGRFRWRRVGGALVPAKDEARLRLDAEAVARRELAKRETPA